VTFNLTVKWVLQPEEWELLRLLRNSTAEAMTRHQGQISPSDQAEYARTTKKRHYLYFLEGVAVGWSSLSNENEFAYGVSPLARGLGFGHSIIAHLQSLRAQLIGEAWDWNAASLHIMQKAGFVMTEKIESLSPAGTIIKVEWNA